MSDPITVGDVALPPGSKRAIKVPVTIDLNGGEINLWVHAVCVRPLTTTVQSLQPPWRWKSGWKQRWGM